MRCSHQILSLFLKQGLFQTCFLENTKYMVSENICYITLKYILNNDSLYK